MTDYEQQKLKGNQMASDCDCGYMVMQGITKGTTANIEKLVELNKPCEGVSTDCKGLPVRVFIVKNKQDLETIKQWQERFSNGMFGKITLH